MSLMEVSGPVDEHKFLVRLWYYHNPMESASRGSADPFSRREMEVDQAHPECSCEFI